MKKFTLFAVALTATMAVSAQSEPEKMAWAGSKPGAVWAVSPPEGVESVANFLKAPGYARPGTWAENSIAQFLDEYSVKDTVKVYGTIVAKGIEVNNTTAHNFVINKSDDNTKIQGEGALIKEGTGDFVMDVPNELTEGTIARGGRVVMKNTTSTKIWGNKILLDGGAVSVFSDKANSSSDVIKFTTPVEVSSKGGTIECSRYVNLVSPVSGTGDLTFKSGGERVYLGDKNVQPDWSNFTGNVILYPKTVAGTTAGFYGFVLNSDKKASWNYMFAQDNFRMDSLDYFTDSTFYNRKLTMKAGTALSAESSGAGFVRIYKFGELSAEDNTCRLYGFYKNSDSQNVCYRVGSLNTNVVFPAVIASFEKNDVYYNKTSVTFWKEGTGTYTLTGGTNYVTGGIYVSGGKLFVANDPTVEGSSATGNRGTLAKSKDSMPVIYALSGATIGGTGIISGPADVADGAFIEPGCDGIGTLTFNGSINYGGRTDNSEASLRLHGGATAIFEITKADRYDKVDISHYVRYYNEDGKKPVIKVQLSKDYYDIKDGDEFVLISAAKGKDEASENGVDIVLPEVAGVTWSYEEKVDETTVPNEDGTTSTVSSYKLIVKAAGSAQKGEDAIENTSAEKTLSVYPNPSNGEFNVEGANIATIEVYNNQGQLVNMDAVNATSANINLNGMAKGVYYAKVKTTEGEIVVKKLVIK